MKKIYCDCCERELSDGVPSALSARVLALDKTEVSILVNTSKVYSEDEHKDICRYCIISAVAALDDRPEVAPPSPDPRLAVKTVDDLRAAFPELSAAVFDEGKFSARAQAAYFADPPPPPRNAIKTPYDEDWGKLNTLDYYAKNALRAIEQEVHAEQRAIDQKATTAHIRAVPSWGRRYKIDSDVAALGLALRALEAAEANRREAKSMNTDPVNPDPNADYGAAGHVLARAAQHLDESIPNGQRVRTEKAFYAAGVGLELLGEWLRAKGHEV